MPLLLTFLFAFAGGWAFKRLKVPGGMMIGSVVGACVYNLISGQAVAPVWAKVSSQVMAGAFIGVGVQREDLRQMRTILKASAIVLGCYLVVNVISGLLIYWLSPLDLVTALMASVPGGLSDIPIIAADMGADASKVLALQFVRFLMGIALFPTLIARLPEERHGGEDHLKSAQLTADLPHTLLTLAVAAACGLLGRVSPIPGGTMALAAVGSIAFKLVYPKACMLKPLRRTAQYFAGLFVGAGVTMAQIRDLRLLALPVVILLLCYFLGAPVIGWILRREGIFGRREAFLAATPAGASDMALISADLGVYDVKLVLLQMMRLIVVITLFPSLLGLVIRLVQSIS